MTYHKNLKLLTFVGMTGSGKSTAVEHFTNMGYPKIYLGGFAYEIMAERGIEKGEENEKKFRVDIRNELGNDVYAKRAIDQIEHLAESGQHRIIIDGIYSWDEYKTLKHNYHGEMTTVAIVTPKHKRYHQLAHREDRPQTEEVSSQRDYKEIEDIQKAGPIAMADFYAMNDGDYDHLYEQLDVIARDVEFLA